MANRRVIADIDPKLIVSMKTDDFDHTTFERDFKMNPRNLGDFPEIVLMNRYADLKRDLLLYMLSYNMESKINGLGTNYGTTFTQTEYEKLAENYRAITSRIEHWNDDQNSLL
tara:strand:+ start:4483 stop:4821 length:339 start_codon:yes stop_codon:yes gene_type:complete